MPKLPNLFDFDLDTNLLDPPANQPTPAPTPAHTHTLRDPPRHPKTPAHASRMRPPVGRGFVVQKKFNWFKRLRTTFQNSRKTQRSGVSENQKAGIMGIAARFPFP